MTQFDWVSKSIGTQRSMQAVTKILLWWKSKETFSDPIKSFPSINRLTLEILGERLSCQSINVFHVTLCFLMTWMNLTEADVVLSSESGNPLWTCVCCYVCDASFYRSISSKIRNPLSMTQWSGCCSHSTPETIHAALLLMTETVPSLSDRTCGSQHTAYVSLHVWPQILMSECIHVLFF